MKAVWKILALVAVSSTLMGRVEENELVSLEIELLLGEWLSLRGEVVYIQPGIGFGLLFNFLTDDQERALMELFT
jgi:hypothetical protein